MIKLLDEFDSHKGWQVDGVKSFAHWLNWQVGMGNVMAREKVRVARALRELPLIDTAFAKGEVSYSKVRAMTRVATTENETFLLEIAEYGTAQQVEHLVKKYKMAKRLNTADFEDEFSPESCEREKGCFWYQEEDGLTKFEIHLPSEDATVLIKAIENIAEVLKEEHKNVSAETFLSKTTDNVIDKHIDIFAHRADALTLMAEHCLSKESDTLFNRSNADTQHVLLHINANQASRDYKINKGPFCHTDDNQYIQPDMANKISCDASVSLVLEDDNSNVINIGRKTRVIPLAMKRALKMRDQGCVFPGCGQTKWTDIHHIKHWVDGGETSMDNLVTLCRFHHTQLHKGEYRIETAQDQEQHPTLQFINNRNEVMAKSLYPQFENFNLDLEAMDTIETLNKNHDLNINHKTVASKWQGDQLDMHLAVELLFNRDSFLKHKSNDASKQVSSTLFD